MGVGMAYHGAGKDRQHLNVTLVGSALSYLKCQENALHVYGAVTSAVGAEYLQSPKIPCLYPGEKSAQLWVYGSAAAWFGKLLLHQEICWIQRAQLAWAVSVKAFPPASSAWFWVAVLSPLWIKACCLSLVHTSVWYQRKEDKGRAWFGKLKAARILTGDTDQTNSAWEVAAPRYCVMLSNCKKNFASRE